MTTAEWGGGGQRADSGSARFTRHTYKGDLTMDYAFFRPNSIPPGCTAARVRAGSWDSLSAELGSTAESYDSVLSSLTTLHWRGPASDSMAAAGPEP
jgi:PPE-repeat protein